jgi:hypothetical protein
VRELAAFQEKDRAMEREIAAVNAKIASGGFD